MRMGAREEGGAAEREAAGAWHTALERGLRRRFGPLVTVREVERRPYAYRTSSALDEVDVLLEGGTRLELLFKDTSRSALQGEAVTAKPAFLSNPSRELSAYRFLARRRVGPVLHGAVDDPRRGRHWLFLERVPGVELYQVGDFDTWRAVARWLARFHAGAQRDPALEAASRSETLLRYDGRLMGRWLERARAFVAATGAPSDRADLLERIAAGYGGVLERILARPPTFVHGELYASNVLVRGTSEGLDVVPVDWEMAGVGPGLLDLAALVAGSWSADEKRDLALAYHRAFLEAGGQPRETAAVFLEALDCSRLQVAVQWMGWALDWQPPPEHVQDWEGEAGELVERLGL